MKEFVAVGFVFLAMGWMATAGESPPKVDPAKPWSAIPRKRRIDDHHVKVAGMKLPVRWFYRNVGTSHPPNAAQEPSAGPRKP